MGEPPPAAAGKDGGEDAPPRRRTARWAVLLALLVATAGAMALVERSEDWRRAYFQIAVASAGFVALSIWAICVFVRGWRARLVATVLWAAVVAAAVAGMKQLVRVEGAAGTGLFELRWRWDTPAELEALPELAPNPGPGRPAQEPAPGSGGAGFPRFLGVDGDGVVSGVMLGTDWGSRPPEEIWRRPIGLGWSGFVVAGGRAVTHEQRGGTEIVSCYALGTGEPLWAHTNEARFSESMGGDGPRATPTIDGGRVYALGATGILDCLELATGEPVWSREVLGGGSKNLGWGKSGSPLVHGGLVVVTGGDEPGPALLAFDKETGEPAWTAGEEGAAYASPVVATVAGVDQILTVNAKSASGHAPDTGRTLWRLPWGGAGPKVGQPIPAGGDRVLLTASYNMGSRLVAFAPAGDGGLLVADEVWESNRLKTKFSSAVVKDGFAYGLDEGRLACVSLEDGSRVWRGEKYGYGQNLLVGDVILVLAESGEVALVAADPTGFRELARFSALDRKTWNPPALAGDLLVVRNAAEAACFRLPLRDGPQVP